MEINKTKNFINKQLEFFMNNMVNYDNLFIPDKYNIISKKPASSENMVNDLGDYIQYLYAADNLLHNDYNNKILKLVEWTFNQNSYKKFLSIKKSIFDSTIDTGDFLVGLNCMLYSDISEVCKSNILKTIDTYLEEFYPKNLKSFYSLSYKGISIPIIYCYSIYNDIEELVYIYEYTNDNKYLEKANELYTFISAYKVNSIPTIASINNIFLNSIFSKFNLNAYNTVLSKTMSNYCSASIKLSEYNKSINIQEDVITPLIDNFYDKKRKRFATVANDFNYKQYNLVHNHPAISLFIDYNFATDFDYISIIDDIISENEEYPYNFFKDQSIHLDAIVDFATILLKIYDKSKNIKYFNLAVKYLEYIDENFRTNFGFFVQGDTKSTEVIYSTKFQSLLLKPYILLYHILNGKSIYNDKFLYLLSRDR